MRFWSLLCLLAALVVVFFTTQARGDQKTIAVHVEGPHSDAVRGQILDALPKTLTVVEPEAFSKALAAAGQRGAFGNALAAPKQRGKIIGVLRRAAAAAHADSVVLGRVRGKEVFLFHVSAKGEILVDRGVPLETTAMKAALASSLETAPPQVPAETPVLQDLPVETTNSATPDAPSAADARPAIVRTPHEVPTELFELGLAFELGSRAFDYKDPLPEGASLMRSYKVFGIAALAANGATYPLASSPTPVVRDLGLTFEFAHAFGLESVLQGGEPIRTFFDRYGVGLRGRIRTGAASAPVIGLGAGYGKLAFGFSSPPPALESSLAAVSYSYVRFGADGRVPFGPLSVLLAADYLAPLSSGEVYRRFTGSRVKGIDAKLGLSVRVLSGVETRLLASYTRYFSSFKSVPGDAYVAGGALDEFFGLALGAAYIF